MPPTIQREYTKPLTITCPSCGHLHVFNQPYAYHAGFGDQGFLYNDAGDLTLVWSAYDPDFERLAGKSNPWVVYDEKKKKEFEDWLPPAPRGGRWRFGNLARCLKCKKEISPAMGSNIYYVLYDGSITADSRTQEPFSNLKAYKESANQPPLRMPVSGTPAVGAPVAPTSGAADFSMKDSGAAAIIDAKKAVIFDLFHTLTSLESTLGPNRRTTSEMLGVSREDWNDQLLRKSRDRLVGSKKDAFEIIAGMARAIDRSISDEKIKAASGNRIAQFAAALSAIPAETIAVLESLKKRGKRIGLISNADVTEAAAWGGSKIGHLFDSTIFSCVVGCVKPEREIYELSLRELGVSPDEAVFVGDGGSNELEGAKKIGMATIMMTGIIKSLWPEQIADRRRHADFVIEQLNELTFSTSQEAHMP